MKRFTTPIALLIIAAITGCSDQNATLKSSVPPGTPDPKSAAGPALEIVQTEIDLTVRPGQQQIIGEIFIFNVGGKPLRVLNVSSTCAGFSGYSGDRLLPAGSTGTLYVKFDKTKIPPGQAAPVVKISTNDHTSGPAEVRFKFHLERSPNDERIRLLREDLSAIRTELKALRSDMAKLVAAVRTPVRADDTQKRRQPDTTVYDIALGSSPVLGSRAAPVTIAEFADLQCPYCIREYPKVKEMVRQYPDKVRVVFKHFPLRFHVKAKPTHAATELARLEGGDDLFWKMHDKIVAEPRKLNIADLREHAKSLNMDLAKFDEVMADNNKINELVTGDFAEARKCGVRGTPTIFINGRKLADRTLASYKARIDHILAEQKTH